MTKRVETPVMWNAQPWRTRALVAAIAGAAALLVCVVGWVLRPSDFYFAYLSAWMLWLGMSSGCAALLLIHHLTGGRWGWAMRQPLESAMLTVPVMALLSVPVFVGLRTLYPWTEDGFFEHHEHLALRLPFFSVSVFVIRAIVLLLLWSAGTMLLRRWSMQARSGDDALQARLPGRAAVGLIAYMLTMSLAAVDWLMSLDPEWSSSMFGVYVIVGHGLGAVALLIVLMAPHVAATPVSEADVFQAETELAQGVLPRSVLHDLGNFLLLFVVFFTYIAFSQFLIIWSGNLPEEVTWYARRMLGGWRFVPVMLGVGLFALPLLALLSRQVKRASAALMSVACLVLIMRWIDQVWVVLPSHPDNNVVTLLMTLLCTIGVGGIWLAVWWWPMQRWERLVTPLPQDEPHGASSPVEARG